ncbi:PLP-dependent cysteine synthase family protein [Candidatus Epulonipiscium viviparus]|uniref:PLP-dependent cysteine synthase family protein n=1 Tax=Candidatus Epulonipiscium viviparus TaxID=420336 RepID=UPI00016BFB42|nr:pyridoxal-phosphate dependent enzyme [Candidatus Epulopiscium viviparus]
MIYSNITELVGKTPVVRLKENLYAKLEYFNPGGSIKDRIAKAMLEDVKTTDDIVIIEPTSGNTGIGIAMICAAMQIRCKIIMPDTMSIERRKIISAYGAEIILTEGKQGMKGAIAKAEELLKNPNYKMCSQFTNRANAAAHYLNTAVEIMEDFLTLEYFVAAIGTGGTITGVAHKLKDYYENLKIVGIEPEASPFLTKGIAGPHKIQGIGAGFKPAILDLQAIDKIETVTLEDAVEAAREMGTKYGILPGFSGGANYFVAREIAKTARGNVLFVVPDNGERYLSTDLY